MAEDQVGTITIAKDLIFLKKLRFFCERKSTLNLSVKFSKSPPF